MSGAQQFWDHLATSPGTIPGGARSSMLRGRRGEPIASGFSRTYHWELSGAARANYQFSDAFRIDDSGDEHKVVFILSISYASH